MQARRGTLAKALVALVFCGALAYGGVVALAPWSLHIGGHWTPLLTWHGSGKLLNKGGIEYPVYISFFPSSHFSQLHMDGLRPTGGLKGSGWLCTSRGVTQSLELSGTIYGAWRSTDGSLMAFRLLERRPINLGQDRGFFDLIGKWSGPELVMDSRSTVGHPFRSGLKIEHPLVAFDWGSYSDFEAVCANANLPARQ